MSRHSRAQVKNEVGQVDRTPCSTMPVQRSNRGFDPNEILPDGRKVVRRGHAAWALVNDRRLCLVNKEKANQAGCRGIRPLARNPQSLSVVKRCACEPASMEPSAQPILPVSSATTI